MKISACAAAVAVLLIRAGPARAESDQAPAAAPAPSWVAAANNAFAADLYAQLRNTEGNLFFSPNSIEAALAMTYAGARGRTADQMARVLHVPQDMTGDINPAARREMHGGFAAFLKDLGAEKGPDGKPRGYQLSVANALWGQKGYVFLPEFLGLVKTNYGAGLTEVDFATDTEGARRTINAWVEKETRDKIKDLLKTGILVPATRLVLTNAIYFKGDWAAQFKKADTRDAPFHLAADRSVSVAMMNRRGEYGYVEQEGFQALKLPYVKDELSMVVLLPKKVDGLAAVEKSLAAEGLHKWIGLLRLREVIVAMPKYKITAEFELNRTLAAMGMPDAFSDSADFSGMDGKKDLYISNVVHKAYVDVNEEGTEAAAATAVVMREFAAVVPERPPVFRADHPFVFLIRHEKSGAILFMGRVATLEGPAVAAPAAPATPAAPAPVRPAAPAPKSADQAPKPAAAALRFTVDQVNAARAGGFDDRAMRIQGVVGVGTGGRSNNDAWVSIMCADPAAVTRARAALGDALQGIPIRYEVTGVIRPL